MMWERVATTHDEERVDVVGDVGVCGCRRIEKRKFESTDGGKARLIYTRRPVFNNFSTTLNFM